MVGISKLSAAAFAGIAAAAPMVEVLKERANIDLTVLQFALTLEHLENVFYKEALGNFTLGDFQKAGYSAAYYNNLKYIAFDEQEHVQTLSAAIRSLGEDPVAACTYNFNFDTVKDFITLSSVLEGVGTSAYLGAAPLITDPYYLTVAGSILAVEALHTSLQRTAVGEIPNASPFYTPLDPSSVYTLAASFIKKCPKSNAALPFDAFPSLAYDGKSCTCEQAFCGNPGNFIKRQDTEVSTEVELEAQGLWWGHHGHNDPNWGSACKAPPAGATVKFTYLKAIPQGSYVTFVNGLTVTSVKGTNIGGKSISAKIPTGLGGQTYVFVTKSDVENTFDDSQVIAGPAVLEVKPAPPVIDRSIL